jgi:hypothetical protein
MNGSFISRLLLVLVLVTSLSELCDAEANGQAKIHAIGATETNVNGIVIRVDQSQPKDGCSISSILDSNLVAGLLGAVAGLLGYYLADHLQRKNQRKSEAERYLAVLESVKDELRFYGDKLGSLSGQLGKLAADLRAGTGTYVFPSYTVYPAFLEKMRLDLVSFGRNREIVLDLGSCYFELGHILERLNQLKSALGTQHFKPQDMVTNVDGTKGLVDQNIQSYKDAAGKFDVEIERIKAELQALG